MYDICIIGAGASGLAAAYTAASYGKTTVLLERNNEPGRKLYATGNGHCNFLNMNYPDAEHLLSELAAIGISAETDDQGRCYPKSGEASFVVKALVNACRRAEAEIICDFHVCDIAPGPEFFRVISKDGRRLEAKKLCIATGGKAGIQYGCYGEAYRWLQQLGHSIVKPVPALVPLETFEDINNLFGVRVKASASLLASYPDEEEKLLCSSTGEVQFAKDSVSGICVMNLSRFVRFTPGISYTLSLDLFPGLSIEKLAELMKLQHSAGLQPVEGLLPGKMLSYIMSMHGDKSNLQLARVCKDLRFSVKGTKGWSDAQVTSGGISMNEIDTESFQSKKIKNLYLAGEICDYDGFCGGYNLSFAWDSGIKAGRAMGK